jgi:Acyl carrier protein phosphodiesterase
MKKLLFLNSCVNRNTSRTYQIAKELISSLTEKEDFEVCELVLEDENIQALTSDTLNERLDLLSKEDFSNEKFNLANQFKNADCIVISAPYWDFGFPTILKSYIEATSIVGVVYKFSENGQPIGLCSAEKMYYVTTRGGYVGNENDLGFATLTQLGNLCGIKEVTCIGVDGFDIPINDPNTLVKTAINDLPNLI